ncbi:uncharacterized protein LAESUDRAFT_606690, partial [Laetiporus sulphureus 93-53]
SSTRWPDPVGSSSPLLLLKSTFQAHACRLPRDQQQHSSSPRGCVDEFLEHLVGTVPRAKRATHAMWAWRGSSPSTPGTTAHSVKTGTAVPSGSSDGGESGAGDRLAQLLELSRSEDVILVVFRWYGGVQLGGQRWKCISAVAKEALENGGFLGNGRDGGESERLRGKEKGRSRGK